MIAAYLPAFLMATAVHVFLILLPLHVLDIGGSPAAASFVVLGLGLGMLACDIPVGFLASRFGDKRILLAGTGVASLASFCVPLSGHLGFLFAMAVWRGAASSAWILGLVSHITAALPANQRGRAISVFGGAMRFGVLVGPLAGGSIATAFGYEAAFLVAGVCSLAAFAIVLTQTYPGHVGDAAQAPALSRLKSVISGNIRIFMTAGYAALGLQMMRAGRQLLIPLFGYGMGLEASSIGLIFSLSALVDMTLFYPAGMAMDRYGRKRVGVPSLTLFAAGLALLAMADSLAGLLAVGLLLGFANGLGSGFILTMGSDLAPVQRRAEFLGAWRVLGDGGMVVAPLLIGTLVATSTLAVAAFAVAGVGASATLVLWRWVDETLKRSSPSK